AWTPASAGATKVAGLKYLVVPAQAGIQTESGAPCAHTTWTRPPPERRRRVSHSPPSVVRVRKDEGVVGNASTHPLFHEIHLAHECARFRVGELVIACERKQCVALRAEPDQAQRALDLVRLPHARGIFARIAAL